MTDAQPEPNRRLLLAYADSSRELVAPLQHALDAAGFSTLGAPSVQMEADAAIDAANAVLVCWTPAAVANDVVSLQAARARKARKLVSILLAPCTPPGGLGGRFWLADLSGWRGDPADKGFVSLVQTLNARIAGRIISPALWRSSYVSWGGAGALALGAVAIVANFGDLRQTFDGFVNPGASEKALSQTDAKVTEVLNLLKAKSPSPLDPTAEAALRESIERLLSAQSGARGSAADKLARGDIEGALKDLNAAAQEGEKAAAGLSETWQEIGALAYGGHTQDAIRAYERAVELSPTDPVARNQLGNLYIRTGRLDEATATFQRVYNDSDDDFMLAIASGNLGVIAMTRGDLEQAEQNFRNALETNERIGELTGQAGDLGDLGEIYRIRKDYKAAEAHFRRSLALYVQTGNTEGEAVATARLGAVARDRGKRADAIAFFESALKLSQNTADYEGQAFAHSGLGDVAYDSGHLDDAKQHYLDSLAAAREVDARESEAVALTGLGDIAERQGDKIRAIEHLRNARDIYRGMGVDGEVTTLEKRLIRLGATPSPEGPEN